MNKQTALKVTTYNSENRKYLKEDDPKQTGTTNKEKHNQRGRCKNRSPCVNGREGQHVTHFTDAHLTNFGTNHLITIYTKYMTAINGEGRKSKEIEKEREISLDRKEIQM